MLEQATVFDSQALSKDKPLEADARLLEAIPISTLQRMASAIKACFQLTLFGFDVVIEQETGKYYLFDVNYFPCRLQSSPLPLSTQVPQTCSSSFSSSSIFLQRTTGCHSSTKSFSSS